MARDEWLEDAKTPEPGTRNPELPAPHVKTARTRRELLRDTSAGFGMLALAGLAGRAEAAVSGPASDAKPVGPLCARAPHFAPRAKRVIFLFMHGGPSGIDTFDPKPRLEKENGGVLPFEHPVGIIDPDGKILKSPWEFKQHGQSGIPVSSLFPHVAELVDDLCVIRGMHTEGQAHGQAVLKLHTGDAAFVRPSLGAWVQYGLGTENENLPGFVTICPTLDHGGVQLYGNAFLPAVYQGTALGNANISPSKATFQHVRNASTPPELQRKQLDFLQTLNQEYRRRDEENSQLEGVVQAYELAFRMQMHAPQVLDLSKESKATLDLYGIGDKITDDFGRECLLARRFAEAGVRFIQVTHNPFKWDQHSNLKGGHEKNSKEVDKPIAGLLRDLKSRGMLDDTLVIWGGEFGRTPTAEKKDGRDHNPHGYTMWLAGAGVKPGFIYGSTDEYGYYAVENKVHMHDLHATILHLLGMDHTRLTYRYAGRDFRLTDVFGNVVKGILA